MYRSYIIQMACIPYYIFLHESLHALPDSELINDSF